MRCCTLWTKILQPSVHDARSESRPLTVSHRRYWEWCWRRRFHRWPALGAFSERHSETQMAVRPRINTLAALHHSMAVAGGGHPAPGSSAMRWHTFAAATRGRVSCGAARSSVCDLARILAWFTVYRVPQWPGLVYSNAAPWQHKCRQSGRKRNSRDWIVRTSVAARWTWRHSSKSIFPP